MKAFSKGQSRTAHINLLTNNRIVSIEDGKVTFSYCDRSDENKIKELSVKAKEFIRRFLLHVLPSEQKSSFSSKHIIESELKNARGGVFLNPAGYLEI